MATYEPIGLTYLIAPNTSLTLGPDAVTSPSGRIGPVTLKVTNVAPPFGEGSSAALAWQTTVPTPEPPVTYPVYVDAITDIKWLDLEITITPGVSAVVNVVDSTDNWIVGDYVDIPADQIGGIDPYNNIRIDVTALNPETNKVSAMVYTSGLIPGGVTPIIPTPGDPTNTVIIPTNTTEYVQIPNSIVSPTYTPLTLVVGGASVYVTPVQIIV